MCWPILWRSIRHSLPTPVFQNIRRFSIKPCPYIVELRSKSGDAPAGEIETCFNALYGMLMLRLTHKEVTKETSEAVAAISAFIAALARNFHLDEADKLFPPKD